MSEPLLEVQNLKTQFFLESGVVPAVDGISFDLMAGQVLGLVGESGSGKSVTALSILRLVDSPGRIVGGKILYSVGRVAQGTKHEARSTKHENHYPASCFLPPVSSLDDRTRCGMVDLLNLDEKAMRKVRGSEIAMIFQEPMTSLNPVYTIGNQIEEGIRIHQDLKREERKERVITSLSQVRIPDPKRAAASYPHELSGGMRQRAMIAMALACEPRLLLVDEPTTALDVTIQAQILNLLRDLQSSLGMTMLFITHDLGVIAQVADSVLVMQEGKIVEQGAVESIYQSPKHPYTKMLLRAVPRFKVNES